MTSHSENGFLLPAVINPPKKDICIQIPDEPQHRRAFLGQLSQLGKWYNWERDEAHTGREVAQVWKRVFQQVLHDWNKGCKSCRDGDCVEYRPTDITMFSYQTYSPFLEPGQKPLFWDFPQFITGADDLLLGLLFEETDVIVTPTSFPGLSDFPPIPNVGRFLADIPKIQIDFEGSGEIELHFLKVVQGGLALVVVDDDETTFQLLDLASFSLLSAAQLVDVVRLLFSAFNDRSLVSEFVHEIIIESDGPHKIEIYFLPQVELSLTPEFFGYGGGLRRVVFCGDLAKIPNPAEPPPVQVTGECVKWFNPKNGRWECIPDTDREIQEIINILSDYDCDEDCEDCDEDCEECN